MARSRKNLTVTMQGNSSAKLNEDLNDRSLRNTTEGENNSD